MDRNLKRAFLGSLVLLLISVVALLHFFKDLEARIYGTISGRVIAEDTGKGVEGATVLLFPFDEKVGHPWEPIRRTTDKEGNFKFEMVREGKYLIAVEPPSPYYGDGDYVLLGKYDKANMIILKKGGVVYNLVKVVRVGGSISGRILKKDGTGHAGALVYASTYAYSRDTVSGADGSYRIDGLMPAQDYRVRATIRLGEDFFYSNRWRKTMKNISVEAKKETKDVNIVIDLDDSTGIEGKVTSADGKPLAGAGIDVQINESKDIILEGHTFTDGEGRYSIKGLTSGYGYVAVGYSEITVEGIYYQQKDIYIQKGKMNKIDFVIDLQKKGIRKENFLKNEEQTQKDDKSNISDNTFVKDPIKELQIYCNALPQYYLESLVHTAYRNAINLINNNCGEWKGSNRKCVSDYAIKGGNAQVTIMVWCEDKDGCYGTGNPITKIIKIVNPQTCGKDCLITNLILHEILHVGGSPGNSLEDEQFTEACTNLCFPPDCQSHPYGSKSTDCCCEK